MEGITYETLLFLDHFLFVLFKLIQRYIYLQEDQIKNINNHIEVIISHPTLNQRISHMTDKAENRDRQTMKNLQARTDVITKLEDKASKVLVLSLGSHAIKMGFANQKAAFTIQPFIAYRRRKTATSPNKMEENQSSEQIDGETFNKQYLLIQNYLKQQCVISMDSRPAKGKPRAKQVIPMTSFPQFTTFNEVFYSEEALVVQDMKQEYIFRKPISYGQLNIADNSPEELKMCLNDIQNLLKYMLKNKLQIPENQWKTFSCIIVLPDVFIRSHVKALLSMIFNKIGFSRLYAHLESILACLGTVTSSACVIDIGHQKISVCCVDQGVILPKTLVRKNFGLKHVSKVLIKLINNRLTEEGLQLSINNQGDQWQVDQYKQTCLAIKQPEEVLNKVYQIKPIRKGKQITVPIQYGDNLCVSGNAIYTQLWNSFPTPKQFYEAFDSNSKLYGLKSDPEDFFEQYSGGGQFYEIEQDNPLYNKELVDPYCYVPIQQLVTASIMSIKDPQLRRKFLSSILVIGGGGCIPQLADQLINRVSERFKDEQFQEKADLAGDLFVRQIDPSHASWLGGTVLPKLDSLRDLWIEKNKFIGIMKQQVMDNEEQGLDKKLFTRKQQSQQWGLRYLKQKLPFLW